ncbi:hypothetical protein KKA00_09730, partial [bacterium]|nr:hypothetical protein [bacterium]
MMLLNDTLRLWICLLLLPLTCAAQPLLDLLPDEIPFSPGEMGPAMLILRESNTQPQTDYTQTITLHDGWNLVSWHVDLDPNGQLEEQYIPALLQSQTWFCEGTQDERIYRYESDVDYYPLVNLPPPAWPWDYDQAYYMLMVDDESWQYTDHEQLDLSLSPFTADPSEVWDEAELGQWQTPEDERFGENWYFISYPVPGYTKLATVYDDPEHPNGA